MINIQKFTSKEEILFFQEEKMKETLQYVSQNSTYYKRKFAEFGIDIQSIKSLSDLVKLPITTKQDLQKYNEDFICVPKNEIIDIVTTSGTTGDPVSFYLTENDLQRLAYNEATSFSIAGICEDDVVQLMTTMDRRFMAGLAYFLGLRKLGATVIRVGAGIPELQWESILKFKPTYIITVPSFILKLIDFANKNGIDYKNSSVKGVICIGESLRNQDFSLNILGNKIKNQWDIDLHSTYASTEMSTAFTECGQFNGGHQIPELIIVEILDENNKAVADGEVGELTITTLGMEGMPLVRFKTGDILSLQTNECKCGNSSNRVSPVLGRKNQMIKYKGTTLYPAAMNDLVNEFDEIKAHFIEISTNDIETDEITIKCAVDLPNAELLNRIKDHFRAKLRVAPQIIFEHEDEIHKIINDNSGRKPNNFIDKRNLNY